MSQSSQKLVEPSVHNHVGSGPYREPKGLSDFELLLKGVKSKHSYTSNLEKAVSLGEHPKHADDQNQVSLMQQLQSF